MSVGNTGIYERAVQWVTDKVKPYLHQTTGEFVDKSVEKYAKDNPRFARMIEFEVRRRGDGAGLTQDVAEPLIWIGVKTAMAVAIEVVMSPFKKGGPVKWIGHATAIGIVAQQAVELFRLLPRFRAGLQGSLEMARDRWRSIEQTGVDPFSSQTRQINKSSETTKQLEGEPEKNFTTMVPSRTLSPAEILKSKQAASNVEMQRN